MSYTLTGRLESRFAALVAPVLAAAALSAALGEWWPLELAGLMAAAGLVLDLAYHPALAYQPGWAGLPLGLLELGATMSLVRALGVDAPLRWALLFFAVSWLWGQLFVHALLPVWRMSWAEDGGELGRGAAVAAFLALALPFAAAGGVYRHNLPPLVHLSAGVHQGPLVIDRRERLVGEPGTVVRGGIVVRHRDVTISHLQVVGGAYGISVLGVKNVTLDHVKIRNARLDGIHARHASVHVRRCEIDLRGAPHAQGIDISYGMIQGTSDVEDCTVVGGRDGIVVHGSMAMFAHNRVESTRMTGISMVEMSMGEVAHNTVSGARGIGILCGDRSMCEIAHNEVAGTIRDDAGGNRMRAGIGVEVEFWSEAELHRNELTANPQHLGVFLNGTVDWK
jgi:hypothetical protein